MSTPRALLVEALTGNLPPEVRVEPYARELGALTRGTLMLRLDEVGPPPPPLSAQTARLYTFTLLVLVPQTRPGLADDELDALLEDALYAIEQTPSVSWTKAARGVWVDETTPAYEVTLEVPFTITDPTA